LFISIDIFIKGISKDKAKIGERHKLLTKIVFSALPIFCNFA
jgi:hypothetical protein